MSGANKTDNQPADNPKPKSRRMELAWPALAEEMQQYGVNYTAEQLQDPTWCFEELARLGYAASVTYMTRAKARHLYGREPAYPAGIDGVFTYQLWGPRYPKTGNHPSPITFDLKSCIATALFNIVRLNWQDMQKAKT